MSDFNPNFQALYIFENIKSERDKVKVGYTTDSIQNRIQAINKTYGVFDYLNDDKNLPVYSWTYRCAYSFSKEACAYTAEQLTHKYLKEYLDKSAPIGEVFNCSLRLAVDVVERVIEEKGWEEYVTKLDGW